ncbi:MAG TPA: cytochrome c [Pirellulales bacterium]
MKRNLNWMTAIVVALPACLAIGAVVAGPADPGPLSKFAPLADLVILHDSLVTGLGEAVADESAYTERKEQLPKDAHTLAAVVLVMAHHDGADDKLKASAGAQLKAAQALAKAKDFATAKAALADYQAASKGEAPAQPLPEWGRVASQGQLMKQVTIVNSRLRRNMRRFEERDKENARDAALLIAIAQATNYDTHEVKDLTKVDKWYQYCDEMRDSAAELSAKIHSKDKAGAEMALGKILKSCEGCHEQFRVTTTP